MVVLLIVPAPAILRAQHEIHADTGSIDKKTIYTAAALTGVYYTGSILILNHTWYNDRKRVPFHFYNDNSAYLQVDKFGHMFGSYVYSYIGYNALLRFGATREEALIFGSSLGFMLQLPVEIMDGLHEGYGFSWGDIAANAIGSALVAGQELLFGEQVVKYKFSYWESDYSRYANGYLGETTLQRILEDYNGHTYWFSVPVNEICRKATLPDWFSIALGYGANGMYGEFENITSYNGVEIPQTQRYRQLLLSADVDWTRIKTESRFLKTLFTLMTFVKLPFPALEYNSKGEFKTYWMYY